MKKPQWLRELVNEHDVEPKSVLAASALEIALSPRAGRISRRPRPRRPRPAVDPASLPPFDKDLQCAHCGKQFRRVCNYREHQRVHSNEYKFACSVHGCDRKFMWRSSIQAHLRSHQAKLDRLARAGRAAKPPPALPLPRPAAPPPKPPRAARRPVPLAPAARHDARYAALRHSR